MPDYLHNHKDFAGLIKILGEEKGIEPGLVEKDYWIMHVLCEFKKQGFGFELKGGTSLSKGYKIIHRFSEDIDIHIKPPEQFDINENPKNCNEGNVAKRKKFYDWLAKEIKIPGIVEVKRDTDFDEPKCYRSGGIRLFYNNLFDKVDGSKEGILFEAGFANATPNSPISISSWAYDRAVERKVEIVDNRAVDIICYHPGYTLIEKLQAITTKFRSEQTKGDKGANFMRQYYDVYCLLGNEEVVKFIGTEEYEEYKEKHFSKTDLEIPIQKNEAFLLSKKEMRAEFADRYKATAALYYQGQPPFDELITRVAEHIQKL